MPLRSLGLGLSLKLGENATTARKELLAQKVS